MIDLMYFDVVMIMDVFLILLMDMKFEINGLIQVKGNINWFEILKELSLKQVIVKY